MASVVRSHGIVSVLDELMTMSRGHSFFKSKCPKDIVGKKIEEAIVILKIEDDAILLAIEREGAIEVNPPAGRVLFAEDFLFVASRKAL